uniref:Cytochrome P450 2G1-like n=1 Tax=Cyanistes caeruleus TaxID=156563 RepID=A0A8C0Z8R5_CYACU
PNTIPNPPKNTPKCTKKVLQIIPKNQPKGSSKIPQNHPKIFSKFIPQKTPKKSQDHTKKKIPKNPPNHLKVISKFISKNTKNTPKHPKITPEFIFFLIPGVVFADGERWRQLRRFSLMVLRDFGMGRQSIESRIQEEAQELLHEFQKTQRKPFDPTFLLSCAVSNIICSIVFGNRFQYQDPEFLELLRLMNESFREMSTAWAQLYNMAEPLLKFVPGPHRRIPQLLGTMRSFVAQRVQDNARTLDPHSPRDFIDMNKVGEKDNPKSEFTMENLELTTLNLFFAGTETMSSTLRFGLLFLMRHPQVEEKIFKEISQVVGFGRAPALADRSLMPFTDATIHEIQRCSDPIPMNVPHRVTRDTEFRGFCIPKGTDIYPLLSSVLNDPESFKNPQNFDPGNFLDEQGRFQRNKAFVPFSAGKRLCLGEALVRAELFLFLTSLLQRLRPRPPAPPEELPTAPLVSGFANIPPHFQLRLLPR